jgi:Tol biopolymer transport system component
LTKSETGTVHIPQSWSPDGKTLLFTVVRGVKSSLWTLSMPTVKTAPYGGVEAGGPISAAFSPDGRLVAYANLGIFVQTFPATGTRYRIADNIHPFWSPDGSELLFSVPGRIASVAITTTPSFTFGKPKEFQRGGFIEQGPEAERAIDITPDGTRFVGIISADQSPSGMAAAAAMTRIHVVEHWFEDLKRLVPAK